MWKVFFMVNSTEFLALLEPSFFFNKKIVDLLPSQMTTTKMHVLFYYAKLDQMGLIH